MHTGFPQRIRDIFSRENRNAFRVLAVANFKKSDYDSLLGVLCSLVGPVSILIIMHFVFFASFGKAVKVYPLYLLLGIVLVNFFVTATTFTAEIFYKSGEIVKNTLIAREILLFSDMTIHVVKLVVELGICLLLSIAVGTPCRAREHESSLLYAVEHQLAHRPVTI